ncbi:MAG: phospho-N-acetylmuramoyl-pentapeptide-transferase, partial [Actinomycetota bacterium]|nr:phospho-N-acetylmuramoyl-pentapeptide-transferase [Actinomycetota bacterium]
MIAMLMAAGAAFVVTIFFTPVLIRSLRARGIGQQIRDDGPIEHPHMAKAGTPTMGGIAIV